MASLKIKTGTKRELKGGCVAIEGSCVLLYEPSKGKGKPDRVVFAYCLQPGETVTSDGEDYIVEF
jgi:hypothetical protein